MAQIFANAGLARAATAGELDDARRACDSGARTYDSGNDGMTPLHMAASCGAFDVVEFLLRRGANPNAQDASGATALHHAIKNGHDDAAMLLVLGKTDLTIRDQMGMSPADISVAYDRPKLGEFIANAATSGYPAINDRFDAIRTALEADKSLRTRLGVTKPMADFSESFDFNRLVSFAVGKKAASDPDLGTDIEDAITAVVTRKADIDMSATCRR